MKDRIDHLREHLFMQLERLREEDLDDKGIERETKRARAIVGVSKAVIDTARAETDRIRVVSETGLAAGSRLMESADDQAALSHHDTRRLK